MGDSSRWGALSHQLSGQLAAIDWQLNLVLALAMARNAWSVPSALRLIERLPIDERAKLLDELDEPPDGLPQTTVAWLRDLATVRNRLAHSWIVTASRESATFRSFFRGRHQQFTISQTEMASHERKALWVTRNLIWLETLVGDPRIWSAVMGFDARD